MWVLAVRESTVWWFLGSQWLLSLTRGDGVVEGVVSCGWMAVADRLSSYWSAGGVRAERKKREQEEG